MTLLNGYLLTSTLAPQLFVSKGTLDICLLVNEREVTRLYLATKVLPSGRVTLLGVSLVIIILSLLAIFSASYQYCFLNSMIFLKDQQGPSLTIMIFVFLVRFLPFRNIFSITSQASEANVAAIVKNPPF